MTTITRAGAAAAPDAALQAPNLTPPPGNPRFPRLDALRATAALSVFLGHTITGVYTFAQGPSRFLDAVQLAYEGVAIFFLISGFLLYRPFLLARRHGTHLSLVDYARRRVLRIVPAYWVALTVFLVAGFVSGITLHNWWLFYGFGQIYNSADIGRGIGVAWTLCIEVSFYAALPLFAFAAARLSRRRGSVRGDVVLLVGLAALSLLYRAHFHTFFDVPRVSTLAGTFTWFALGMGLAVASVEVADGNWRLPAVLNRYPSAPWLIAVVLTIVQYKLIRAGDSVPAQLLSHVVYGLVALSVLLPGVFDHTEHGVAARVLRTRSLAWIGLVSYAFYLYHSVVIEQVATLEQDAGLSTLRYPVLLISAFVMTAVVSAASYYVVERPVMRWGSRLSHARCSRISDSRTRRRESHSGD